MYAVICTYTFDRPFVRLFDAEKDAKAFLKEDWESEVKLQKEEGPEGVTWRCEEDGTWAEVVYPSGEKIAWEMSFDNAIVRVSRPVSEKERISNAYDAIVDLLTNPDASPESMLDDNPIGEVYAEAANFKNAVENLEVND